MEGATAAVPDLDEAIVDVSPWAGVLLAVAIQEVAHADEFEPSALFLGGDRWIRQASILRCAMHLQGGGSVAPKLRFSCRATTLHKWALVSTIGTRLLLQSNRLLDMPVSVLAHQGL